MKLLTVIIPCYNSEEYMRRAILSAISGGEEVEILIIDDGSTDHTLSIAKEYEKKHPSIVRAIHKENGGHGSTINTGLRLASGLYLKVLDSDDYFDEESLKKALSTLHDLIADGNSVDLFICNYVYAKTDINKYKVMSYSYALPKDQLLTWKQIKSFKMHQNLIMHSIIFRTKLLLDCKLTLPEHTFYVDNIFAYIPLPQVKSLFYLDINLYQYYIGREDQSVNELVMINRIDQQIKVTKILIDSHNLMNIKNTRLRKYMIKYLAMMMIVSSVLLVKDGTPESLAKRDELWRYLKSSNNSVYNIIKLRKFGYPLQAKSKSGRIVVIWGYHIFRQIYGFN